ncbi:AMP-binding protein [Streptomyces sp. NPDC004609]|uniref:AMP-binding protein n=1 Tax=Streptomyces sp. NPDC004609 TaxID=3364704 RepID=UPI0036CA2C00
MSGGTLHQLFEDRVRNGQDRTAVITDRVRLSYGQLDARANRLARHLTESARLPAGGLVAIRTLRKPDVLVAVLAVLKAGGAYTIVAPDVREPRGVADALAVISHRVHLGRVEGRGDRPLVLLDADAAAVERHPDGPLDAAVGERAAVLFTAGTTGPPKAVPVSHQRLLAAHEGWSGVYLLTPDDRVLVTARPRAAGFALGCLRALCSGATVVLTAGETYTVADTDPWTASSLLTGAHRPAALRLLAVGGERLRLDEHVRLERLLPPGSRLIGVYGPAEVAGCGTWFETGQLPGPVTDPERHVYLGQPFPGCGVRIRKGQIWLTPPGGGDAVATGDLGRRDGDGPLEFRGRMADRVKVDGRTVDTYRVEAELAAHPGIRDSVVGASGRRLIAYLVPEPGSLPGKTTVRSHLTGAVPRADIPETVVTVPALPRNEAGKVDRRALVRPPGQARSRASAGKGGGGGADPAGLQAVGGVVAFVAAVMSFTATDVLWPGSTDLSIVPDPWAWFFRGLYVAEGLAFAAGAGFLIAGRRPMMARGGSWGLTTAAHLAVVYLLASWWPQDNLYRLAAKQDWERQAALVYVFNVPLMIAAGIVAVWAVRLPRAVPGKAPGSARE